MATQTYTLLTKANHGNGTFTFAPVAVPALTSGAVTRIDSTNSQGVIQYTDPATHIAFYWAVSYDGGATWYEDGATTAGGGLDKHGVPVDPRLILSLVQYDPATGQPIYPTHVQGRIVATGFTSNLRYGVFADVTSG